jgi:MGT family glycosyltransferase
MTASTGGTGARVLFTAWPFPGHLFPQIAVANALRRRGCECAFYTGAEAARIVRGEGFTCFPFQRVDEEAIDRLMRGRPANPWRVSQLPRVAALLKRWLLDTTPQQVEDLEPIIAQWRPSVIASDPTMWAPMLVLGEKHQLPVAVSSFVPACMLPGPDAPPFGPGLPRSPGWRGRAGVLALRALNRLTTRASMNSANAIRQPHGLPPLTKSVTEHTGDMALYLVPASPEFDYDRRDLPPNVHYVGPLVWNRPRTEAATPWVERINPAIPCVHVTEGTVHVQEPFLLKAAIEGLAASPVQVVATTGGRPVEELRLAALPANVRIERWISHDDLLPHTQVVVTTGGAGSVLAALAAGVPLVITPTEWDKPEIAQRVAEAGAGIRLAPGRCTPERLRACVLAVLERPSFAEAARGLAEKFARLGGPDRAAELVAALDRPASRPAPPAAAVVAKQVAALQGA